MDKDVQSANLLEMADERQIDFFLTIAEDPPFRDNRDTMEYPFLALRKRRTAPIFFRHDGITIDVHAPATFGIATIWDWDIIIGLSAQINDAVERSLSTTPRMRFVPYNLLHAIGRGTSGRHYRELAQAIRRLRMTTVITNVRHEDGAGEERPFSWVADYTIPKRYTSGAITPDEPHGEPDPARRHRQVAAGGLAGAGQDG